MKITLSIVFVLFSMSFYSIGFTEDGCGDWVPKDSDKWTLMIRVLDLDKKVFIDGLKDRSECERIEAKIYSLFKMLDMKEYHFATCLEERTMDMPITCGKERII